MIQMGHLSEYDINVDIINVTQCTSRLQVVVGFCLKVGRRDWGGTWDE